MMEHPPREPVNGWIHFVGALVALVGLALLLAEAQRRDSVRHVVAAAAFGGSAVLMLAASANYHLRPRARRARLFQRLDHAAIYLFIAGTYTPLCLIALWPAAVGRILLGVVWALAALGIALQVLAIRLRRGVSTALYLGLGWVGILAAPALVGVVRPALFAWIIVGAAFYSVGAWFYWRKWPRRRRGAFGFHELWHVCVLAAGASHFWAIHSYVLPLP